MQKEKPVSKKTLQMREWRAKNAEKNAAYQREYHKKYRSDPDKAQLARDRASSWYAENREAAKKRINEFYHDNKELVGRPKGKQHHAWKGGRAGYYALHTWVVREKGRPQKCERCGCTDKKQYDWANVDHKYKRKLEDFIRLCRSCHRKHDYEKQLCAVGGGRQRGTASPIKGEIKSFNLSRK